ncbi:MAG: hypothetical protein JWP35_2778 [Caulobacter sp.]|nr:hypothetical protein [Caulobacter sp.]
MSEPPIQVDPEGASATPRKTGHNVIDMLVAGAAILISLVSLAVAVQNSQVQNKMLTAASWPMVRYFNSNATVEDGKRVIRLGLINSGVGPAKVESVQMFYKGKPAPEVLPFLVACCGAQVHDGHYGHGLLISTVSPAVMMAGQQTSFFVLPETPEGAAVWSRMDVARDQIEVRVCYCSVFDECWQSNGISLHPPRVKSCPTDARPFPD